jgi:thiamine-monophosphate kinase
MNEFELIARLAPSLPANDSTIVGVGDDCAVLDPGLPGQYLLFKTDAVVEGIHFTGEDDPRKVGHKALARALSDIAAMGGTPTHALVTLALPQGFDVSWVDGVYAGISGLAGRHNVGIVGGETTSNPERVLISVALLGTVSKSRCIRRSGAQAGDAILVSGELGGSLAGRHLEFEPRLTEGRWLAEHFQIHSMIDVSDGIAGDLPHLLKPGELGADLLASAIPLSRAAKLIARAGSSAKPAVLAALTDGEDFELLFTVASADAVPLLDAWKERFPELRLSCIGRITTERGIRIQDASGIRTLKEHGYVHFQKS